MVMLANGIDGSGHVMVQPADSEHEVVFWRAHITGATAEQIEDDGGAAVLVDVVTANELVAVKEFVV